MTLAKCQGGHSQVKGLGIGSGPKSRDVDVLANREWMTQPRSLESPGWVLTSGAVQAPWRQTDLKGTLGVRVSNSRVLR